MRSQWAKPEGDRLGAQAIGSPPRGEIFDNSTQWNDARPMVDAREKHRSPDGRQPPAQVLLRGLAVLEALNRRPVSSIAQIAADTGLPKPTAVRVLTILAQRDYAERLPNRGGYRLGRRVPALSAGYRGNDAIIDIAAPLLNRFTARHKWPVSLATLDGATMRLRISTQHDTPFSAAADQARLARRLPMLTSAVGLAYLAFCPNDVRATLLKMLETDALETPDLERRLAGIVALGYAASPPLAGETTVGFAVPIVSEGDVLGCITLRYFGKALTEAQVAARYLVLLQAIAAAVAANYRLHRA